MLAQARRSLDIPFIQGMAEDLPLADASVDFITMGYALRHVAVTDGHFATFTGVEAGGWTRCCCWRSAARPTRRLRGIP